jgi:hypothetical protein
MKIRIPSFPEAKTSQPAPSPTDMSFVRLDDAARAVGFPSVDSMLDLIDEGDHYLNCKMANLVIEETKS